MHDLTASKQILTALTFCFPLYAIELGHQYHHAPSCNVHSHRKASAHLQAGWQPAVQNAQESEVLPLADNMQHRLTQCQALHCERPSSTAFLVQHACYQGLMRHSQLH